MSTQVSNIIPITDRDEQSISTLIKEQKKAFRDNPAPTAKQRIEHLKRFKHALLKHQNRLINAINQDFSCRSTDETLLGEFLTSIDFIKHDIRHLKKWMKPSRRSVGLQFLPASARIIYQPVGVVGIIAPWNYPIVLAIGPLISALAAGNRVMMKLSEYTPATAEAMRIMIEEIFDQDHVAVITGGPEVGIEFSKQPFDHLFFTGSTMVGHHVMRAAADNLTPVTLELGGKSPTIISDKADINSIAETICFGKAFNAGQTCVAPDYILCPRDKQDEFVKAFANSYKKLYPTIKDNTDHTSIINMKQYDRLQDYLTDAKAKGAKITVLNNDNEDFTGTRKLPIHIIQDCKDEMTVMQEEIFGPLLPIVPIDNLQEAIDYINDRPRPLALYFLGTDKVQQKQVLEQTHSGGVCINDTLLHFAQSDAPFGGIGPSGMGVSHGFEAFRAFSHGKSVLRKPKFNSAKMIYPPYNKMINKLIYKLFIR